jgi:hypothetical protein
MTLPAGFADVLGRPTQGVARMILRHQRRTRFRWFAFVELFFGVLLVLCVLPLLIVLMVLGGDDASFEFPDILGRFHEHWHELSLSLLTREGQVLTTVVHSPSTVEEGDGLVAAVLSAAAREGVVVVEVLAASEGDAGEIVEVWYGGRPLLSRPDFRAEEHAAAVLRQAGLNVELGRDEVTVAQDDERPSKVVVALLFLFLLVPLSPILLFFQAGRAALRDAWDDLRGASPPKRVISVRAESLGVHIQRGNRRWGEHFVDGSSLLGLTFSPTLGFDKKVMRHEASLRLVGDRTTVKLRVSRAAECGAALRDLLVAASLRLRQAKPELGLIGPGPRPTRCPFCTGLYDMQPGSQCPYCGAPAGRI